MSEKKYSINDFLEIKASHSPSINFDGTKVIYFNNDTGTSQLYLLDLETKEKVQLTDFEDYVESASFSQNDNRIIFKKSVGGNENGQLYLLDLDANRLITPLTEDPNFKHGLGGWSSDGKMIVFSSNKRNGRDFDLYLQEIGSSKIEIIFDQGGWCTGQGFSPKGSYITVSKFDSNVNNDLYLVELATKKTTQLSNHKEETLYGRPQWLPDESGFYIRTNLGREFLGVAFYDLAKKTFDYVYTPDWDVEGISISKDGKFLALTVNEDGYVVQRVFETEGFRELTDVIFPKGLSGVLDWSDDGKKGVFDFSSSTDPWNVWLWDRDSNSFTKLTDSHCAVDSSLFVEPELIRFPSFDGLEISAFLYAPMGVNNPPGIVSIHGGPEGQYQPVFTGLTQFLVYKGYAVIAPNVRGSSGYGKTFLSLDNIEKRLDSVKDISTLVTYLSEQQLVDPQKLAVMGGSYGGFMVLACMCFYPELFAAGVDIVGIANFITFLENTSSYRRALREIEYGYLEGDRAFLESISPINHIEKITKPLMVIHGANDPRVPLSEAEQVKEKLEALGRKVELLVYEDEGHGLGKLKNRLDAYPRVVSFLDSIFI